MREFTLKSGTQAVIVLVISLAVFVGGSMLVISFARKVPDIKTVAFRAKPGTMRETVLPMLSQEQEQSGGEGDGAGDTAAGGTESRDVTIVVPEVAWQSEEVAEIMQGASPEAATDRLEQMLRAPHDPGLDSEIHAALAELALRRSPVMPDKSLEHARTAFDLATGHDQAMTAVLAEAEALRALDRSKDARARIGNAFEGSPGTGTERRLLMLDATLAEEEGDTEGAIAAYRRVLEPIDRNQPVPAHVDDATRLAALKLSRLYRREGKTEDARELSDQFSQIAIAR
jgi:tetratricopeptide (TPR) repeat protein